MINRVLIRIKVVHMLYSYLLTKENFKLYDAPEGGSKSKKYAYMLYRDLLMAILYLSGDSVVRRLVAVPGVGDNKYLMVNRLAKILGADSDMKAIVKDNAESFIAFSNVLVALQDAIVKSGIYRSYIRKRKVTLEDDVEFWSVVVTSIFAKSNELQAFARKNPEYSLAGFQHAIALVENTLKGVMGTKISYIQAVDSLKKSLDKAYELYHLLLMLPVELTRMQELRIDNARNKYLPTDEDLNPNLRFIDNKLIPILAENEDLHKYFKENPVDWSAKYDMLKILLDKIMQSEVYADYMSANTDSLEEDCEFWRTILRTVILPSDILAETLEAESVYWNDDLDIIGTFVLKTIRRIGVGEGNGARLLPQYKDEEDARFGAELFESTVEHYDENLKLIERFVDSRQWDPDRLAFMDVVIMNTAITELIDYPLIPIPVTLNEYIEIANYYSTPRSGQFINGILYSVINYLKNEGKLVKK